ncbi:MAG: hypothetical protein KC582_00735 [Candidatus Magasanikbacteria bacterium]|nr:hypothetical protein [Candidatus Magasanikbacteria bacterium]MCA9389263.1 hypothetical protein [Candidatus Magasanikbacteria bacterium]MCA9390766.1 hypothetical protein [Candidatus Magasanikbacteria bacterium]USN52528.1 MAG: hypothetical protein H6759_00380 [Candidatus Nomurabacteria bacterium]HPF95596.1 hypothetical protein [bacterium]
MTIPLWIFLYLWIGIMSILSVVAIISAYMIMRFGLAGSRTVVITIFFLGLPAALILATIQYAYGVDWSQTITLFSVGTTTLY